MCNVQDVFLSISSMSMVHSMDLSACGLRALRLVGSGVHPGATTFPHALVLAHCAETLCDGPTCFPQVPFQYPRSQAATLELGSAELCTWCTRRPDCTSRRLRANRANWAGNWANRANWAGLGQSGAQTGPTSTPEPTPGPTWPTPGSKWAKPTQTGPNLGQPGPTPPSPAVQPSVPWWTWSPQRNVVDVFHGKWLYCVLEVLWNFDGLLKTL